MGALPKRKITKAAKAKRRSHLHVKIPQLVICTHCRQVRLAHHVCLNCGYYGGRKTIEVKEKQASVQ